MLLKTVNLSKETIEFLMDRIADPNEHTSCKEDGTDMCALTAFGNLVKVAEKEKSPIHTYMYDLYLRGSRFAFLLAISTAFALGYEYRTQEVEINDLERLVRTE